MYFEDLSPYSSLEADECGAQNVGWLDAAHAFETGPPDPGLLDALWNVCRVGVRLTRGLHDCNRCADLHPDTFVHSRFGQWLKLGWYEVRVFALSGQSFAAPSLIYHYVADHNYRPPNVFVDALMNRPKPFTRSYEQALANRGLAWADMTLVEKPEWTVRRF